MKKLLLLAVLALAPLALRATPTRLLTVDNMNQVVPDDWDATTYYSLAPHFKNHWYADAYATGKSFGWAFLDVNIGTLVIWYNKDFEGGPIYDLAVANSPAFVGVSNTAFGTDIASVVEPREKRIKAPDTKLGLGFAYELTDSLNLGICFRLAELNGTKNSDDQTSAGAPISLGNSSAYQMNIGSFVGVSLVGKVANTQADNAILVSPQFSYAGDSITLDFKFDMFWPGVDNKHTEELYSASSANTGSVTQTLKDKGRMNWFARPKLRYMFSGTSSLVLRGSYGKLDLSTEHRVSGNFTGTYVGNLSDKYDFVDSSQDVGVDLWDGFLGVVKTWDKGQSLVTFGLGANGQTANIVGSSFQTRNTAATYDDVVRSQTTGVTDVKIAVPLMIGSEISLTHWCKARASIQRNFFTITSTKTTAETFNSDGTLATRKVTEVSSDFGKDWVMNSGFGLNFGQFSWDTAMNLGFLANGSATGFINPLYQSSFTYEF